MPQSDRIELGASPPRRKPSLTPMIDVVFLLLVFFMLAARFGQDPAIPLSAATAGSGEYKGAPRLVEVVPNSLRLNGSEIALDALPEALQLLMPTDDAIVVVRPSEEAVLQQLVTVLDVLSAAGFSRLVLAE